MILARSGPTGDWTVTRLAPPADHFLRTAALALGPDGEVAAVWVEVADLGERGDVVAWTSRAGGFDRKVLAGSDQRACDTYTSCARVDYTAAGDLVAVWSRGVDYKIVAATRPAGGGGWTAPVALPSVETEPGAVAVDVRDDGSFVVQSYDDFIACESITSCESIGEPEKWHPAAYFRFSFLRAGAGGDVFLVYGDRACDGRCFDRPLFASVPAA